MKRNWIHLKVSKLNTINGHSNGQLFKDKSFNERLSLISIPNWSPDSKESIFKFSILRSDLRIVFQRFGLNDSRQLSSLALSERGLNNLRNAFNLKLAILVLFCCTRVPNSIENPGNPGVPRTVFEISNKTNFLAAQHRESCHRFYEQPTLSEFSIVSLPWLHFVVPQKFIARTSLRYLEKKRNPSAKIKSLNYSLNIASSSR